MPTLTQPFCKDAPGDPTKDVYHWDDKLTGFAVKVTPSGRRSYILKYQKRGIPVRWWKIGNVADISLKAAREVAVQLLADVAKGIDPKAEIEARLKAEQEQAAKEAARVSFGHVCDEYLRRGCPSFWRESTTKQVTRHFRLHIKRLWGKLKCDELTNERVQKDITELAETSPTLPRFVVLHAKAAWKWGRRANLHTCNDDCWDGIEKGRMPEPRSRILEPEEYGRVFGWFSDFWADPNRTYPKSPRGGSERDIIMFRQAVCAIELIAVTGIRRFQAHSLDHNNVRLTERRMWVREKKRTGAWLDLNELAIRTIKRAITLKASTSARLFDRLESISYLDWVWLQIRRDCNLTQRVEVEPGKWEDIPAVLHDLRRSFSSTGFHAGLSPDITGKLIGHQDSKTTLKVYSHLNRSERLRATDQIGGVLTKWGAK
jgi:integrase